MKIRLLSDLHNEFSVFEIPKMDDDINTILILAGDIDLIRNMYNLIEFLKSSAKTFKHVVYICGNHEFYHGNISTDRNKIKDDLNKENIVNVTLLEDSSIIIDDIMFIGSTLWTSFRNGCPILMERARFIMNDYSCIHNSSQESTDKSVILMPCHILDINKASKQFLFERIIEANKSGLKSVVITHHSPSFRSITSQFKTDSTNDFYHNNYDYEIEDTKPNFWFHGHTHQSLSYNIADTKVCTNPRGYYPTELNTKFNPNFILEI